MQSENNSMTNSLIKSTVLDWLKDLYQNKVIYKEKVVLIVQLFDININNEAFKAKAVRQQIIETPNFLRSRNTWNENEFFNSNFTEWEISFNFKNLSILNSSKSILSYSSFQICTDPYLVKTIDELFSKGNNFEALEYYKNANPFMG